MISKKEKQHMLMAFTGNAIFGFSFLFSKLALDTADPMVLLKESFTPVQAVGICMVLVGVFGVNRYTK